MTTSSEVSDGVNTAPAIIEARNVSKRFGGVQAVHGASLSVSRGTVHALVGENGAGKSTLGKMLAGAVTPTSGTLLVDGRPAHYGSPRQALAAGIAMIDQELAMVPARSVIDNVFLGTESRRLGLLRSRDQRRRFKALVADTGFDLDADALVGSLRVADQQKVEILRAVARNARLVVMDEPTAPLTQVEAEQLYAVIRDMRDRGATIVFISHFLEEVLDVADTVTVMRDGEVIRTSQANDETPASLVHAMLGRPMDVAFPKRGRPAQDARVVLEARGLGAAGRFVDVSLELRAGEILGLAGLVGSGRTEVARALFGADRVDGGELILDGQPVKLRSPRDAIAAGIVLLPESRKDGGLVMMRSIAENMVLPHLGQVSRWGVLRPREERTRVERTIAELDVRCRGLRTPVETLSGGNQQKVLFGKWLVHPPRVLIVDEPTRGVDVGAKRALYELVSDLARQGLAVLVISSDLEEVLGLAHRVAVMHRGRVAVTLDADEADEERVLAAAFGMDQTA